MFFQYFQKIKVEIEIFKGKSCFITFLEISIDKSEEEFKYLEFV